MSTWVRDYYVDRGELLVLLETDWYYRAVQSWEGGATTHYYLRWYSVASVPVASLRE